MHTYFHKARWMFVLIISIGCLFGAAAVNAEEIGFDTKQVEISTNFGNPVESRTDSSVEVSWSHYRAGVRFEGDCEVGVVGYISWGWDPQISIVDEDGNPIYDEFHPETRGETPGVNLTAGSYYALVDYPTQYWAQFNFDIFGCPVTVVPETEVQGRPIEDRMQLCIAENTIGVPPGTYLRAIGESTVNVTVEHFPWDNGLETSYIYFHLSTDQFREVNPEFPTEVYNDLFRVWIRANFDASGAITSYDCDLVTPEKTANSDGCETCPPATCRLESGSFIWVEGEGQYLAVSASNNPVWFDNYQDAVDAGYTYRGTECSPCLLNWAVQGNRAYFAQQFTVADLAEAHARDNGRTEANEFDIAFAENISQQYINAGWTRGWYAYSSVLNQ